MPYPRAILFDLDDTIITDGDRPTILLEVAESLAEELAPADPLEVADCLEAAFERFWALSPGERSQRLGTSQWGIRDARVAIISDHFAALGLSNAGALAERFSDIIAELRILARREYPGARATVEALKRAGVKLALVTNGPADIQRAKIERFSLAPLFDHIQIEGEHGFGKPDEQAYLHAMAALGVGPEDTWMVGDNLEWEVAAPQRLGIHAIWHDHRGTGLPAGSTVLPDRIVTRLSELLIEE
jgi:putative hydrolase of the HAD superfamily